MELPLPTVMGRQVPVNSRHVSKCMMLNREVNWHAAACLWHTGGKRALAADRSSEVWGLRVRTDRVLTGWISGV